MRVSRFYLSTLKEAPAEADVVSQKLMLRAGMIKKVSSGIYTWMPLGLVTLRKVEQIVREEMNRAGALEVLPAARACRPSCGRRPAAGTSSARSSSRSATATSATSCSARRTRKSITDIVRKDIRSYRQLPVNLYQIQVKFRDEIRPRFGVMRGREFLMKDAYSFDVDRDALMRSLPRDVRRVHADLHAARAQVPRGRRRHRRDRRLRVARVPGARRLGRGRDRLVPGSPTTRRTSSRPRRSLPPARGRRRPRRCARCPRRASRPART